MQGFTSWLMADYNRVIALVAVVGGAIGAVLAPFIRFPLQLRAVRNQERLDAFKATVDGLEALGRQKDLEITRLNTVVEGHDRDREHWYNTRAMLVQRIEELQSQLYPWPENPTDTAVVMVCEDDIVSAKVLCRMLEQVQIEVFVTTKGYDALRHIRASPQFKLMILDFGLPDINGIDVAILARREGFRMPIIGLTGVADDLPKDTPRMKEANFTVVLPKTSRATDIIRHVKAALSPSGEATG